MTKIILDQESKPNPDQNFTGRYLLINSGSHPIESNDFATMKQQGLINYWSREWLEDMDMFYDETGWRLDGAGVDYLRKRGYELEITTVEQKQEARKKAEEAAAEKRRVQAIEAEKLDKKAEEITNEIKKTLKKITFHGQGMIEKFAKDDYLSDNYPVVIVRGSNPDAYQKFGLTDDRRVFIFTQHFFDMWDSECSNQKASKQYIELLTKLRGEQRK